MTYWQVATGDRGRDYSNIFFEYGIMCVGGENQIRTLGKVKEGDIIILKRGRSEILGAGEVIERDGIVNAENERWLGDFDGWNLKAYANVEWHRPKKTNSCIFWARYRNYYEIFGFRYSKKSRQYYCEGATSRL